MSIVSSHPHHNGHKTQQAQRQLAFNLPQPVVFFSVRDCCCAWQCRRRRRRRAELGSTRLHSPVRVRAQLHARPFGGGESAARKPLTRPLSTASAPNRREVARTGGRRMCSRRSGCGSQRALSGPYLQSGGEGELDTARRGLDTYAEVSAGKSELPALPGAAL